MKSNKWKHDKSQNFPFHHKGRMKIDTTLQNLALLVQVSEEFDISSLCQQSQKKENKIENKR